MLLKQGVDGLYLSADDGKFSLSICVQQNFHSQEENIEHAIAENRVENSRRNLKS